MHAWPIILEPVFRFYVVAILSYVEAKGTDVVGGGSRPVPLPAFEPQKRTTSQGRIILHVRCVWETYSVHKGDPGNVFKVRVQRTRFDTESKREEVEENLMFRILITFVDKKEHLKVKVDVEDRTSRTHGDMRNFYKCC